MSWLCRLRHETICTAGGDVRRRFMAELRPCSSYSGRRDRNNSVLLRSLDRGGGYGVYPAFTVFPAFCGAACDPPAVRAGPLPLPAPPACAVELAQLLLKLGAFHDFRDRQTGPYTMTQQSCVSGDMLLLETLLDLGESVHQRDMEGNTLLHLAVHHEHTALAEELLARRANVNAANAEGCTPLWRCVAKEQPEAIQFLCQRGADVNARNALGMPLLQYGIFNASKDVVVLLLQLNARVADVDSMGNSPLHWAARCGAGQAMGRACPEEARPFFC